MKTAREQMFKKVASYVRVDLSTVHSLVISRKNIWCEASDFYDQNYFVFYLKIVILQWESFEYSLATA
jgi:hypothetical protein